MILDLISFIDYIFILRGKEKNVNFDHSITIHNFDVSPKQIRSFIIPLHGIRFGAIIQSLEHGLKYRNIMPKALVFTTLEKSPSYYFLKGPR